MVLKVNHINFFKCVDRWYNPYDGRSRIPAAGGIKWWSHVPSGYAPLNNGSCWEGRSSSKFSSLLPGAPTAIFTTAAALNRWYKWLLVLNQTIKWIIGCISTTEEQFFHPASRWHCDEEVAIIGLGFGSDWSHLSGKKRYFMSLADLTPVESKRSNSKAGASWSFLAQTEKQALGGMASTWCQQSVTLHVVHRNDGKYRWLTHSLFTLVCIQTHVSSV